MNRTVRTWDAEVAIEHSSFNVQKVYQQKNKKAKEKEPLTGPAVERQDVIAICRSFHTSVKELSDRALVELGRHNNVTPTSYLDLIETFCQLLSQRRETITDARQRYIDGLEKIASTEAQVRGIEKTLQTKKLELEALRKENSEIAEVEKKSPSSSCIIKP